MRRSSFTPVFNINTQEPVIVVEETHPPNDEEVLEGATGGCDPGVGKGSNSDESEPGSPVNPYLLCPFPDMMQRRKHSLPSLQITDGITASQVRRLSDVGGEVSISTKEVEFLSTLTQKANPTAGGRRHSVITMTPMPPPLFGPGRRESISAITFSGSRRGSIINPPDGKRGSVHNLQLDIMDGLVQVKLPDGSKNPDGIEEEEDNDEIVLAKNPLQDKSKWIAEAAEEGDTTVHVET